MAAKLSFQSLLEFTERQPPLEIFKIVLQTSQLSRIRRESHAIHFSLTLSRHD